MAKKTEINVIELLSDYTRGMSLEDTCRKHRVGRKRLLDLLSSSGVTKRNHSESNLTRFGYTIDRTFLQNTQDPLTQYFLGFLVTDGNISDNGRISFCLKNTDIDILIKFQKLLGMNYGVKESSVFDKRTLKIYNRVILSFVDATISERVRDLGILPRKTMKEDTPLCDVGRDFWRGVVDGDGCIRVDGNIVALILVGSPALLTKFLEYLEQHITFRTKRGLQLTKTEGLMKVQITGKDSHDVIRLLYLDSPISLNRKQLLANKVIYADRHSKSKS